MKILVVITSITMEDEFPKYFGLTNTPHTVNNQVVFLNGRNIHCEYQDRKTDSAGIFIEIKNQIEEYLKNDNEVFLTYHPGSYSFDIDTELKGLKGVKDVKQYSETMSGVREKLKELLTDPNKLGEFLKFFFIDEELEAKLELLHQCLTPEEAKKANLPKELEDNYQDAFKTFKEKIKICNNDHVFDEEKFIIPLRKLRDALKLEEHG